MDDVVKLIAFVVAGAAALFAGMVGYRVMQDEVLLYIVVVGGLLILAISAAGLTFVLYRQATEARRYHVDSMLTQARVLRTIDGVSQPARLPNDQASLFAAMLGGVPTHDAVDGVWQQAPVGQIGDDDHDG